MGFVHLHVHSQYSFLDGASSLDRLLEKAAELGMPAMALTDHNRLTGAIRFYEKARALGIKPIIGAEIETEGRYHLTLLSKNRAGYSSLCRLLTEAHLSNRGKSPTVTRRMLIEEIKQSARSWQNVKLIRADFQQPVLKRLSYKALERKLEPFRFEKRESGDYEILLVDGVETLETSDALAYEKKYKRLCDQVLGSELATNLINSFRELRAQEPKTRKSLQEILQRRDYIMYSCKLCPGQPKL